jgi:predicted ester cyclase
MAAETMPPGFDSRRLVERFYGDVWNRADENAAREILNADIEFRGSIGDALRGLEGFLAYVRRIHSAFAGYRCRIDDLITAGERAAARMTFAGTHQGSLFGETPTRKSVSWAGAAFFTIDGHRISRVWVLGDTESLKRQIGLL